MASGANPTASWRTVRTCLPHVIERRGYVLITASLAAAMHAPGLAAYAAAKAGAEAFGDSLRCEVKHLGVDVGVAYFGFIDTDMVRGADAHPALGKLRQDSGPLSRTYPVSTVGRAVVEGMAKRSRWVVVPGSVRFALAFARLLQPLLERAAFKRAAEADRAFQEDIEARGVAASSAAVGPGGEAATETRREPAGTA